VLTLKNIVDFIANVISKISNFFYQFKIKSLVEQNAVSVEIMKQNISSHPGINLLSKPG
jgi:hypothetical protein